MEGIGLLALVYAISVVLTAVEAVVANAAERVDAKAGCIVLIVAVAISPITIAMAGFVTMLLWNEVHHLFGWPEIDLFSAVVLTWLAAFLIRGFGPRNVRIIGGRD